MIAICKRAAHVIRHLDDEDLNSRNLLQCVSTTILNDFEPPFPNDHEVGLDSHSLQLTTGKSIIFNYVLLFHKMSLSNERDRGKNMRLKLTKTILFFTSDNVKVVLIIYPNYYASS